jgi:hypothetical protein
MTVIKARIQGRRLELDVPADWPDGTEVEIQPLGEMPDSKQGKLSPEEIAATLAAMDRIEPFEMSEAEFAEWEAERRRRKELDKARFAEEAERMRKEWE